MVVPIIRRIDGHADDPSPLPGGAGHENPACRLGKAGLDPIRALQPPQKLIVVRQIPLTDLHIFRGYGFIENRVLHGIGRQNRQIPGRGIMTGTVQTVGIFKMRPGKAKDSGFVVHQLRKALHRATTIDGQRNRGIVAGGQHQSVQQFL